MLRKSKFRHVVAISLSCSAFDLAPALAGDYDAGYVVPQTSYPAVVARYCDGYGGGQWPYGCGSVGRPVLAPTVAVVAVPPAPRRGLPPIVTKY
jgi:hypothetical protein